MPILSLTLTISLSLVFAVGVYFIRDHVRDRVGSAETDSSSTRTRLNGRAVRVAVRDGDTAA